MLGELLDVGLRERPDHDRVEVAREHVRRVLDRLAPTELEIARREIQAHAAELRDADLERDPGPGRRLLEDHSERAPGQEGVGLSPLVRLLQGAGEVERRHELVPRPVGNPREVPSLQLVRHGGHRHGRRCYCIRWDPFATSRRSRTSSTFRAKSLA